MSGVADDTAGGGAAGIDPQGTALALLVGRILVCEL